MFKRKDDEDPCEEMQKQRTERQLAESLRVDVIGLDLSLARNMIRSSAMFSYQRVGIRANNVEIRQGFWAQREGFRHKHRGRRDSCMLRTAIESSTRP